MPDHKWGSDEHGPVLDIGTRHGMEWTGPYLFTHAPFDRPEKVTLEVLEEFCARTRAWREENRRAREG